MLLAVVMTIALVIIIFIFLRKEEIDLSDVFESPKKRAGKQGEVYATNIIKSILKEDDLLYTNVHITYDGKPAELDNVIINKYGVFIIEVKTIEENWLVQKKNTNGRNSTQHLQEILMSKSLKTL